MYNHPAVLLLIVTALGFVAARLPVRSTMQECRAKYKADHAARNIRRHFGLASKRQKCGINAKSATPPPAAPKPQPVQRQ